MKIYSFWRRIITQIFWRARLGSVGGKTIIFRPMLIKNPSRIFIGDKVGIREGARLEIVNSPGADWMPKLFIGNNVNIEQGAHLICQCELVIEDNVSITPYCAIVDTYHPYDPPDGPQKIGDRLPTKPTFVHIGAGSFIGAHSVILPNTRIGKGCVIGAGSVVANDIPDFSVAVGSPARVLKTFDTVARQWIKKGGECEKF